MYVSGLTLFLFYMAFRAYERGVHQAHAAELAAAKEAQTPKKSPEQIAFEKEEWRKTWAQFQLDKAAIKAGTYKGPTTSPKQTPVATQASSL